jgi:DNA-binding response OmpR family regulator
MDEKSTPGGSRDDESVNPDARQVLIVDDQPEIHTALDYFLSNHNFLVTFQSDGSAGVRWARTHKPDIILLDIDMPVMDGIKTLHLLRNFSETRRIPVLMLTARSDQKSVERAASLGIEGYITKPYDLVGVLTRIKQILSNRE